MRRKNLKENDVKQSTKMGTLLQKLRDAQHKTLTDKSNKWGFNFERCKPPDSPASDVTNEKAEFEKKLPVESTTSVVILAQDKLNCQIRTPHANTVFIPPKIIQATEVPVSRQPNCPSAKNVDKSQAKSLTNRSNRLPVESAKQLADEKSPGQSCLQRRFVAIQTA